MCFLLCLHSYVSPNFFGCDLPSPMYRNLTGDFVRTAEISLPTFNVILLASSKFFGRNCRLRRLGYNFRSLCYSSKYLWLYWQARFILMSVRASADMSHPFHFPFFDRDKYVYSSSGLSERGLWKVLQFFISDVNWDVYVIVYGRMFAICNIFLRHSLWQDIRYF